MRYKYSHSFTHANEGLRNMYIRYTLWTLVLRIGSPTYRGEAVWEGHPCRKGLKVEWPPGPPGWGSGVGLTTPPHKKTLIVTETRSVDYETTLTGGVAAGAEMMLLEQSQLEAQRSIDLSPPNDRWPLVADYGGSKMGRVARGIERIIWYAYSRLQFDRSCYMDVKLGRSPRPMNGS